MAVSKALSHCQIPSLLRSTPDKKEDPTDDILFLFATARFSLPAVWKNDDPREAQYATTIAAA